MLATFNCRTCSFRYSIDATISTKFANLFVEFSISFAVCTIFFLSRSNLTINVPNWPLLIKTFDRNAIFFSHFQYFWIFFHDSVRGFCWFVLFVWRKNNERNLVAKWMTIEVGLSSFVIQHFLCDAIFTQITFHWNYVWINNAGAFSSTLSLFLSGKFLIFAKCAFESLNRRMTKAHYLSLHNLRLPFTIHNSSSAYCCFFILSVLFSFCCSIVQKWWNLDTKPALLTPIERMANLNIYQIEL